MASCLRSVTVFCCPQLETQALVSLWPTSSSQTTRPWSRAAMAQTNTLPSQEETTSCSVSVNRMETAEDALTSRIKWCTNAKFLQHITFFIKIWIPHLELDANGSTFLNRCGEEIFCYLLAKQSKLNEMFKGILNKKAFIDSMKSFHRKLPSGKLFFLFHWCVCKKF